jgi:hypothetical protein
MMTPGPAITIDCPMLAVEPRAALESRAQAELLARGEAGTLGVACAAGSAQLNWRPAQGEPSDGTVTLPSDPRAAIDSILEALDELLNGTSPSPRQPVLVAPSWASVEPSRRAPGELTPSGIRGGAAAGMSFEAWSGTESVLGPSMRAEVLFPIRLALEGGARIAWGLAAPAEVSARLVRLDVGLEYAFDESRHFRVGAAALFDSLHVASSAGGVTQNASGASFGAGFRATYTLTVTHLVHVALGPTLSVRPRPIRVDEGIRESFRIPVSALGALVELELAPF